MSAAIRRVLRDLHPRAKSLIGTSVADTSHVPSDWVMVSYKQYPRYPKIPLSLPKESKIAYDTTLIEAAFRRASADIFRRDCPVSLEDIRYLTSVSCAINRHQGTSPDDYRRVYPSGGARYPIEVYFVQRTSSDLPSGVYHYDPLGPCLEQLPSNPAALWDAFVEPSAKCAPTVAILTYIVARNEHKYGMMGISLALLEAGHIGQGMVFGAAAMGIRCRPFVGFDAQLLGQLMQLAPLAEHPVYCVALGR
jgi:SagB-type dehydrogenase family enzyme